MLILFVAQGANCIGFNYIIIRRQGWINISVGHIRDYSIHDKYGKEACCTFKNFIKLLMWCFILIHLSQVELTVDRVQALVNMVMNFHVLYRVRNYLAS
jgi:hypothetical protein